jgi:hypothetical protein
MKRHLTIFIAATSLAVLSCEGIAASPQAESVSIPVTDLQYGSTGITDGVHGELMAAPAYGDLVHGSHGTFIKMPAGFISKLHTHTGDYWGVVISGVAVNGKPGSTDIPLPVGSYWLQKGGESHITKCISPNECILFISQKEKFDYILEGTKK